jgi:hypothetical protein
VLFKLTKERGQQTWENVAIVTHPRTVADALMARTEFMSTLRMSVSVSSVLPPPMGVGAVTARLALTGTAMGQISVSGADRRATVTVAATARHECTKNSVDAAFSLIGAASPPTNETDRLGRLSTAPSFLLGAATLRSSAMRHSLRKLSI